MGRTMDSCPDRANGRIISRPEAEGRGFGVLRGWSRGLTQDNERGGRRDKGDGMSVRELLG